MSQEDSGRRFTKPFLVLLIAFFVAEAFFASRPLLDKGDGFNAILPLQVIGVRETLRGNFWWTDELGLGYPILDELNVQQANPFNLLYLVLDPIRAFHVQVVAWVVLLSLSAWFCLGRLFPGFGSLECAIYLALVMNAPSFQYTVCYQAVFLSSFAILPFAWLQIRKIYARCRFLDVALLALSTLLLIHSQYNFTLVPNMFVLGLIVVVERHESGAGRRRGWGVFALLCALLAGFGIFHVFDVLEILRLSNRKDLTSLGGGASGAAVLLAKVANLRTNLARLFGSGEWRVMGSGVALVAFVRLRSRARPLFPWTFHLPFLFLFAGLTVLGLAFFDAARHLERIAVMALFLGAIWFSLVAGSLARKIAVLAGRERWQRSLLVAVTVVCLGWAAWGCGADPTFRMDSFERQREVASAVADLFGGKLPEDLDRYRVGSVVEDDFRYTLPNLQRCLYQPSQAVLYGFHETGYYGSYLINGARRPRTYEQIVTVQRSGIYGNLTALVRGGLSEPILRLLNVKYLIAHEELDSAELAHRGTIPGRDPPGFPRQHLYELRHPLPRAWALPLAPGVLEALEAAPFQEATDRLESFVQDALTTGAVDSSSKALSLRRSGRTLRLEGLAPSTRQVVFVSMAFWPAWIPSSDAARPLAPFGLTAFVVGPGAGGSLDLEFKPSTAAPKIAGALLVLLALVASAWIGRRA